MFSLWMLHYYIHVQWKVTFFIIINIYTKNIIMCMQHYKKLLMSDYKVRTLLTLVWWCLHFGCLCHISLHMWNLEQPHSQLQTVESPPHETHPFKRSLSIVKLHHIQSQAYLETMSLPSPPKPLTDSSMNWCFHDILNMVC